MEAQYLGMARAQPLVGGRRRTNAISRKIERFSNGWRPRAGGTTKLVCTLPLLITVACPHDSAELGASLDLRRHFCSRTTQFITPLARYLNTLIPNPSEVKNARARGASNGALRLKAFNTENFMDSLRKNGSPLPFKSTSKRTEFYERWAEIVPSLPLLADILRTRWLKSPAFGAWLVQQEGIVQEILNAPQPT
jgi:hypothetical protein